MSGREGARMRADYRAFRPLTTRWADNDVYGHVNNVVYYAFFDTAVNLYLIEAGVLDPARSPVIGLVVETQCRYRAPISFPDMVTAGICVTRLGTTSVRYEIGLFRNDEAEVSAAGHFVHVYVDRLTNRPTPLPAALRDALAPLCVGERPGSAPARPPVPDSPSVPGAEPEPGRE